MDSSFLRIGVARSSSKHDSSTLGSDAESRSLGGGQQPPPSLQIMPFVVKGENIDVAVPLLVGQAALSQLTALPPRHSGTALMCPSGVLMEICAARAMPAVSPPSDTVLPTPPAHQGAVRARMTACMLKRGRMIDQARTLGNDDQARTFGKGNMKRKPSTTVTRATRGF